MRTCTPQQRGRLIASLLLISCVLLLVSACEGGVLTSQPHTQTPQIDWKPVDQAIGKGGVAMPGGIHRYSFPRTDLTVTVQDVHLKAGFALVQIQARRLGMW